MPKPPSPTARSASWDAQWQGRPPTGVANDGANLRSRLLRIAVLPAVLVTLIGAATVVYLQTGSAMPNVAVYSTAGALSLIVVIVAAVRAAAAANAADETISELQSAVIAGQREIQQLVEQLHHSERSAQRAEAAPAEATAVSGDVEPLRPNPTTATPAVPVTTPQAGFDHRVGVFVNLARRLQSLVHREIQLLDDLEAQVEDPDLLKGLFAVDHLATRIRRHAENLAVLGGAVPRRQWSKPINIYVVLRSAVAEVEQYSRVKLVRPLEGMLEGGAVADVVHLVAELVENAAKFSNPSSHVLLRAQEVTAGIAIEVEDRGLGMTREDLTTVNAMLASPDQVDVAELLNDGRIGLFVVSTLARRHGIAVQLQTNIYGGIQAVIVIPPALLGKSAALAVEAPQSQPQPELSAQPQPQIQLEQPQPRQQTEQPVDAVAAAFAESATQTLPIVSDTGPIPAPQAAPVQSFEPSPNVNVPQGYAPEPVMAAAPDATSSATGAIRKPLPYAGHSGGRGQMVSSDVQPPYASFSRTAPQAEAPAAMPETVSAPPVSPVSPQAAGYAEPSQPSSQPSAGYFDAGQSAPAPADNRPLLPQRRKQTHLAPQLREAPAKQEETAGHDPGLMMAFKKGMSRAETPAADEAGSNSSTI